MTLTPITPVPVVVLTGALGAGKTTLLNAALKSGALGKVAVIVNEFGAVGIDNVLIESSSEGVVLLPGGCVCCEVRADLAEALLRLERSAARKDIPAYEKIVIETSGLAEPGPILQLFAESPLLTGRYRLELVLTVVDALLGRAALEEEGTALRQALLADRILVTKTERIGPSERDLLDARLYEVSPHAAIVHAARDTAKPAWFGPVALAAGRALPVGAMRARHDDSIECFILSWAGPQPLAAIGQWLHGLAETHGGRLLRVKGIVGIEEDERAAAVHVVQQVVSPPDFLPSPAGESRVVFITRGLEPGDVLPPWRSEVRVSQARRPQQAASTPTRPLQTGASSGATARR